MIKDFCETTVKLEHRCFELVRRLKAYYPAPDDPACKRAVEWFCETTGESFLETWSDVNGMWDEVHFIADGNSGFDWAAPKALESPIDLTGFAPAPREPQHVYLQTASLAVYLHDFNLGQPFLLPVEKVACWLGYETHKQVSKWILPWLKEAEIVTCVDASFRFGPGGGRCKKYQLTAPCLSFLSSSGTISSNKAHEDPLSRSKPHEVV